MTLKSFKSLATSDNDLSKLQDNIDSFGRQLISKDILDGLLLSKVSLTTGVDNIVSHKLGKRLKGFVIVRQRASSIIWDSQDDNPNPSTTLILNCSANVVVDLWVF